MRNSLQTADNRYCAARPAHGTRHTERPKYTVQEEGSRLRGLGERVERRWMHAKVGRGGRRVHCAQKLARQGRCGINARGAILYKCQNTKGANRVHKFLSRCTDAFMEVFWPQIQCSVAGPTGQALAPGHTNPKPTRSGANPMSLWPGHISSVFATQPPSVFGTQHSSDPKILASTVGGCDDHAAHKRPQRQYETWETRAPATAGKTAMAFTTRWEVLCAGFPNNNHKRNPLHSSAEARHQNMRTSSRRERRLKPAFAQLRWKSVDKMEIHPTLEAKHRMCHTRQHRWKPPQMGALQAGTQSAE